MSDAEDRDDTEKKPAHADEGSGTSSKKRSLGDDLEQFRTIIARVVWGVCVLFAVVLAGGALAIALGANQNNSLVEFVLNLADGVDLGVFDLDQPIWRSEAEDPANREKITALINYGAGAVAYLIVGRILEKLIRP